MDRRMFHQTATATLFSLPEAHLAVQSNIVDSMPDGHVQLAAYNGIERVINLGTAGGLALAAPQSPPPRADEIIP